MKQGRAGRRLTILLLSAVLFGAEVPRAFSTMGETLQSELEELKALQADPAFDREAVEAYADAQQACFETGYLLDDAVRGGDRDAQTLRPEYLRCLRELRQRSRRWQHDYSAALNEAIERRDRRRFDLLTSHALEPLQRPSLKRKALAYYESIRGDYTIAAMEAIRDDMRIEERSTAFLSTEKNAFRKNQEVLSEEAVRQTDRPVVVSTKRLGDRFLFYAKNRNIYPVTLTLELPKMENLRASRPLPLVTELSPYASREILEVEVKDPRKRAGFSSRYSWVMGRLSARHSDPLYRLPFAAGSKVTVSQGFDGGVTHKGLTRYAVDFQCPEGTKIYAARGGKVVAAESSHNRGGFDKSFGDEANYIIIEHDDHTLGKYYHLKQYGVMVRVGESVRRGQFIGYSGNTGYSSGPHLHFSVSSVDPVRKNLPTTLPFRFGTARGVVTSAKTGDVYVVKKLR